MGRGVEAVCTIAFQSSVSFHSVLYCESVYSQANEMTQRWQTMMLLLSVFFGCVYCIHLSNEEETRVYCILTSMTLGKLSWFCNVKFPFLFFFSSIFQVSHICAHHSHNFHFNVWYFKFYSIVWWVPAGYLPCPNLLSMKILQAPIMKTVTILSWTVFIHLQKPRL